MAILVRECLFISCFYLFFFAIKKIIAIHLVFACVYQKKKKEKKKKERKKKNQLDREM
jgi:predicted membrane protein